MRYFLIRFDALVKIVHVLVSVRKQCHMPSIWLAWCVTCHTQVPTTSTLEWHARKLSLIVTNIYLSQRYEYEYSCCCHGYFDLDLVLHIPSLHYGKMMRNPSIHLDVVVKYSPKCDMDILLPKPYMCIENLIASNFGTIKGASLQKKSRKWPNRDKGPWQANPWN